MTQQSSLNQKKIYLFSLFLISSIISLFSALRLFTDNLTSYERLLNTSIEAYLILGVFFVFLYTKKNIFLYEQTKNILKLHVFFILAQAFFYPEMQSFVAKIWGTDVGYNLNIYKYRFIGLAGSYVPASILCSLLFLVYFFEERDISLYKKFFYISLALIGCALTARTGLAICGIVLMIAFIKTILFSTRLYILLLLFLILFLFLTVMLQFFDAYEIQQLDLGILFQFSYFLSDVTQHFSQEWRGNLSIIDYLIGTGDTIYSPGDNGYTMFISQHGVLLMLIFFLPYIYLLSKKRTFLALAFASVLFMTQLKTDFFFSIIYMIIGLNLLKNI